MGRGFSQIGKLWGFTKWLVGWPLAIFGITGITDSYETWARWIDRAVALADSAMSDPRVQQLANEAVRLADFINRWPVRAGLVILGGSILLWGWRPFWRLRHKLWFLGKRALNQRVWISYQKAMEVVHNSQFARARRALSERAAPTFSLATINPFQNDPARDTKNSMFYNWCGLVLEQFGADQPDAVRKLEKSDEYDEGVLTNWLDSRYRSDLITEFGSPR